MSRLGKRNDALLINNAVTAGHNASVKHVSKSRMNDLSGFLAELLFSPSLTPSLSYIADHSPGLHVNLPLIETRHSIR